jgi:hypothetical protein
MNGYCYMISIGVPASKMNKCNWSSFPNVQNSWRYLSLFVVTLCFLINKVTVTLYFNEWMYIKTVDIIFRHFNPGSTFGKCIKIKLAPFVRGSMTFADNPIERFDFISILIKNYYRVLSNNNVSYTDLL